MLTVEPSRSHRWWSSTPTARGASDDGFTFHDRGGPYGRTKGAKRAVAVDVTGLPLGAHVVTASAHENHASERMLKFLTQQGVTQRLELLLLDRAVIAAAAIWLGRQATRVPPHPARTASRGRTAALAALTARQVVREHHNIVNRVAPGRLHRDDPDHRPAMLAGG
jgi:hypothetical protein